ncbi:MAG: hypothetical protein WCK90_03735 [archaeon]
MNRTDWGWDNLRKKEAIEEAREILEFYFDIRPTMSDRMFLRQYVLEAAAYYEENPYPGLASEQAKQDTMRIVQHAPDPALHGAVKLLMVHYNFKDVSKMRESVYHRPMNFSELIEQSNI